MTILKNRNVKTKREHQCFSCLRKFPPGTEMRYLVCTCENDFYTTHTCKICQEIMDLLKEYNWEEDYVDVQLNKSQTPEELLICLKRYKK